MGYLIYEEDIKSIGDLVNAVNENFSAIYRSLPELEKTIGKDNEIKRREEVVDYLELDKLDKGNIIEMAIMGMDETKFGQLYRELGLHNAPEFR